MAMATIDPPIRPCEMGRSEAEEVTQAIKNNFDSLGEMLAQARDRKAYKALGYKNFEIYCQIEFGKSVSRAYQLIEDAKILSQLEARISENYGEEINLKIPASHLQPLKAIATIDDKLKVLEFAQKLAAGEGKKPTKQHLEIAVFEISGKRSEDFKIAIHKLGFTKGTAVEAVSPIKKDRGVVVNIDKSGLIYVEHYYGSNKKVPYRATELRILTNEEKPTKPLEGSVASKGDRVLIFAEGLRGKEGFIYAWKEGKTALVMIDGQNSPTIIAYAEMELIKTIGQKNANWESELVWEAGKNTYYYFPQEDKIVSNRWPTGLTLEPYTHSGNPVEFMEHWENKFSPLVLESLITPKRLEDLLIKQVIELSTDEGRAFATGLIDTLQQFLPQDTTPKTITLQQENQRLREQLTEAEAVIQAMVNATSTTSFLASSENIEFSIKNTAEVSAPGDNAAPSDFLTENTTEISSPGDNAAPSDFLTENTTEISSPGDNAAPSDFLQGNNPIVLEKKGRILKLIAQEKRALSRTKDQKRRIRIKNNLRYLEEQLEDLDKYENFKVGDIVTKVNFPDEKGTLARVEITPTGMPLAWVQWLNEYEQEPSTAEQHPFRVLTNLSIQNNER